VWHELAVDARGGMIRLDWNGRKIVEVAERSLSTSGHVGLWVPSAGVAFFDELTVERVSDAPHALEVLPLLRPRS
jgi:hypothetical protein